MAEAAEATELVAANQAPGQGFLQSPLGKNIMLGAGIALVIAIMVAVWLWYSAPDY